MRASKDVMGFPGVSGRSLRSLAMAALFAASTAGAPAQVADEPGVSGWRQDVWTAASNGDTGRTLSLLDEIPDGIDPASTGDVRAAIEQLRSNIEKRETLRTEQIAEQRELFAETMAAARATSSPADLSDALSVAINLDAIVTDPASFRAEAEIVELIDLAAAEARRAEESERWLDAAELFARLNFLTEDSQRFKADLERQILRRDQLTLYVPERYWAMRDARQRQLEQRAVDRWPAERAKHPERFEDDAQPPEIKGLPPFNPRGEDYRTKLADITPDIALAAVYNASRRHISSETTVRDMAEGGLAVLEMLLRTGDMREAFPSLADEARAAEFSHYLADERARLKAASRDLSIIDLQRTITRLLAKNEETVDLPDQVVIHEFGAGAMNRLDEYSAIIWPHELRQFYKRLGSSFIGVGIQIVNDPITGDLEVYTPLSGMPAMRAGVRAGDIITHVDGEPMIGITTDQAVDIITGPQGTTVTLTIKRTDADGQEVIKDIVIARDEIDIPTVTGWKRLRPDNAVDAWDWFVDPNQGIGYLRLDKFAEESTRELDAAIGHMRRQGLNALVLDLRFNSGGQFDRAIEIVNRFVDQGVLVSTINSRTEAPDSHRARPFDATLRDIPVAILINENSASASEIVAGAVKAHATSRNANAIVIGRRSYGKGTVQNVHSISQGVAALKVTTQYYQLPDGKVIHRRPGSSDWGVAPNLSVDLLPDQVTRSLLLRRNADTIQIDENGAEVHLAEADDEIGRDPADLLTEGIDLQLETAVVLLKTQVPATTPGTAMRDDG
jgi:carboxyl-terminal processing protease